VRQPIGGRTFTGAIVTIFQVRPDRAICRRQASVSTLVGQRALEYDGRASVVHKGISRNATFTQRAGYVESRRTPGPRWFAAARISYIDSSASAPARLYEAVIAFRPNTKQLVKFEYQIPTGSAANGLSGPGLVIQLLTSFWPLSLARGGRIEHRPLS
jgi:hypothetical protein